MHNITFGFIFKSNLSPKTDKTGERTVSLHDFLHCTDILGMLVDKIHRVKANPLWSVTISCFDNAISQELKAVFQMGSFVIGIFMLSAKMYVAK